MYQSTQKSIVTFMFRGAAIAFGLVFLGACQRGDSNPDPVMGAIPSTTDAMVAGVGETTGLTAPVMTDAEIFAMLDVINDGEVELGKLARDKASNAEVKAFARDMVAMHEKMEDDAEALAKRLNLSPKSAASDSLKAANDATEDWLDSLAKGMTFDTAYVNNQVVSHEKTVAFLTRARSQATSAELKTMLETAQPEVQKHLDRVRALRAKVQ